MNRTPQLITDLRAEILVAPVNELPSIRGHLAALEAELLARLTTPGAAPPSSAEEPEDRLLDVAAVAEVLGMSSRWVREHQDELPRVTLPGSAVRFSRKRLATWVKNRSYG